MSSKVRVGSQEEANQVTKASLKMVDMAIDDNENDVIVDGIADLEFWM